MSERKGILAALFVAATGHAWIRYRTKARLGWLALAIVCAVCGVWSKAPALFGPLAFAAWDLILLPRARSRWLAIVLCGGAALAASIPVVVIASQMRVIDENEGGAHVARAPAAVGLARPLRAEHDAREAAGAVVSDPERWSAARSTSCCGALAFLGSRRAPRCCAGAARPTSCGSPRSRGRGCGSCRSAT